MYDGDCSFCKMWVKKYQSFVGDNVKFEPYQNVALDFPEFRKREFESEVKLIFPNGTRLGGAEAVFALFSLRGGNYYIWNLLYNKFPLVATASEFVYKLVARNRKIASRITEIFLHEKYLEKNNVKTFR